MFNRAAYENSRPGGVAVLEVAPPGDGKEAAPRFVPLKRTELTGEVVGPLAALRVTHVYGYSREECDQVLEAIYRFPLPGDAAVTAVRVTFGDVAIQAELKERKEAESDYEEAREAGRQAALATRESPDVFTLQVAGIQPDQPITVETSYVQLARPDGVGWSLRIPLTTGPRYSRSDEEGSRHAQGQPLALFRDPGHRFAVDLMLPGATAVKSATHELAVSETERGARAQLRDGEVIPDRDCVLSWQVQQETSRPALQVMLHEGPADSYFLALVTPPAAPPRERVSREVILLVDHSGSMTGAKWAAADWAVQQFVSDLTAEDTFNVGLFHNTTRWLARTPRKADASAVTEAVEFLKRYRDHGGTELGVALEQALDQKRDAGGERARHVLIITDAEVTDAGRILRLVETEAQRPGRRRISVLCIDAAPNAYLAGEVAERGGGVAKFLTSDPQQEDITTALDEVLADWAAPIAAGLVLAVNRTGVAASGREVTGAGPGESAVDLGDLPAGRSLWVAGRVPGAAGGLEFRITSGKRELAADSGRAVDFPALKALFGARRVLGLEHLMNSGSRGEQLAESVRRLGYDPDRDLETQAEGEKIYAENARADTEAALRGLLVREALAYGLASSETAFVAVREEAGQPVERSVAIGNALPAGWFGGFLTAAGVPASVTGSFAPRGAGLIGRLAEPLVGALGFSPSGPRGRVASPAMAFKDALEARRCSEAAPKPAPSTLFAGVPRFTDGEALLFDSAWPEHVARLGRTGTFSRLTLRFPDGAVAPESLDAGLCLLVFVEDMAAPRARVRLVDVVRQGGVRPLNIARRAGQALRVMLIDPNDAWATAAPKLEIELS